MNKYIKDHAKLKQSDGCHSSRIPIKDKTTSLNYNKFDLKSPINDNKENINLNSSLSASEQREKLKQIKFKKKHISRNDIKNIDLNQIKFHRTYVNQKSNTLVSQIWLKDDKELKLETPNIAFEEDQDTKHKRNLKLMKDLGIQNPKGSNEILNFREHHIKTLDIIKEENHNEKIQNPYFDKESSFDNKILSKDSNSRSKSARSDSNWENRRQPRLRKENSYKAKLTKQIVRNLQIFDYNL